MDHDLFAKKTRKDFPILQEKIHDKPLVYFDSAATCQKPQTVIDAITNYYAKECGTVHRSIYSLSAMATENYNRVREKVADFLHAQSSNEIVFTRGTTDGINLVAGHFAKTLQEGDEILISEMEHHSNMVPWQMVCQKTGARLKIVPVNEKAEICLDTYRSLLSEKTKLVSFAHVANSTGTVNPIKTLIDLAHEQGAEVLIDAAQSAAHISIDVQALDVDYLAFSGHKLFGPTGIGVLFGKYHLLEKMDPIQGGGDMIETVTLEKTTYANPPIRFEAGTPLIAQVMGLGAAIDYINDLTLESIHTHEQALLNYATEKLKKIKGLRIIGEANEKSAIISFVVDQVHHLDLATLLDFEAIAIRSGHHCAQPLLQRFGLSGTCRISFCPFNTFEEIDFFVQALNAALEQLAPIPS